MTVLGADPDQLEATAVRMMGLADDYDQSCNQIAYWLGQMAWEGSEAYRFRSAFNSTIAPQLGAAAAFARQAAGNLRAHASDQTNTSDMMADYGGTRNIPTTGIPINLLTDPFGFTNPFGFDEVAPTNDNLSDWLKLLRTVAPIAPIGLPQFGFPFLSNPQTTRDLVNYADKLFDNAALAKDLIDYASLFQLHRAGQLPSALAKLPTYGLEKLIGGATGALVSTGLSRGFAAVGAVMLPTYIQEFHSSFNKMMDGPYIQPEDVGDTLDAFADIGLAAAGIVGLGFPPAGLAMGAFFGAAKLGANLDTPIIWAVENLDTPIIWTVDNVVYPALEKGGELFWATARGVEAIGGAIAGGFEAATGAIVDGLDATFDFLNPFN